MKRFRQRLVPSALACALLVALGLAAWGPATGSSQAQSGTMLNCPAAGKWSIAVWDGQSGTAADAALTACGAAAAYSLDAQTGGWWRWFADKPEVSNLPPLNEMQGVLVLGSASGGTAPPTVTGTPTPQSTASPAATPTGTPPAGGDLSQQCFQAWQVAETLEMLIYVEEQAGWPTAYIQAELEEQDDFIQANCMSPSVAEVPDPTSETLCQDARSLAFTLAALIGAAEQEGVPHVYFSQELDQLNSYIDSNCP